MKIFNEKNFDMVVHDDRFIEFKVRKGISFTAEDIWLSRDLSVKYMPGKKFFVLTEAEGEFNPTPDARQAGASKEYAKHVAALALWSDNTILKILGNLFISIKKPAVPTRMFDEREKAVEWLRAKMKEEK
jgi:hypothetical protein